MEVDTVLFEGKKLSEKTHIHNNNNNKTTTTKNNLNDANIQVDIVFFKGKSVEQTL